MSPAEARRLVGHSSPQPEAGTSHTPGPWTFGKRRDGSLWLSLGDPTKGRHFQGDLAASVADARLIVSAPALQAEIDRLRTALRAVRACTDPQWQAQLISDALRETKP